MPLLKPTACIFDLDGTLVQHSSQKLIEALERYDSFSYILTYPFTAEARRSYMGKKNDKAGGRTKRTDIAKQVKSNPIMHRAMHAYRHWRGIEVGEFLEPAKSVFTLLSFFQEHNVKMAVASNAYGLKYGYEALNKFGMTQYMELALFRENCRRTKPDPEPILRTIDAMSLGDGPQVIWYIGDQAKDMRAVLKADSELGDDYTLVPLAFRAPTSTAFLYLNRLKRNLEAFSHIKEKIEQVEAIKEISQEISKEISKGIFHEPREAISNQNFVRSFGHLLTKVKPLFSK